MFIDVVYVIRHTMLHSVAMESVSVIRQWILFDSYGNYINFHLVIETSNITDTHIYISMLERVRERERERE